MENIDTILHSALERGRAEGLPYAGALKPEEAFALLGNSNNAQLVDVRTGAELHWVGRVPEAAHIEWNTWPAGTRNPEFEQSLAALATDKEAPLLFLCRSGVRSHSAAALAAQMGYRNAFNILEGFEGDKNANGQRNTVNGWRAKGLPWLQS